jgi:hypothetical protein
MFGHWVLLFFEIIKISKEKSSMNYLRKAVHTVVRERKPDAFYHSSDSLAFGRYLLLAGVLLTIEHCLD